MAPAISHDLPPTLRALLNRLPTKRDASRVLAKRSTQNTGYLAAIVVLSAIIIGYALYRLIKYYRARHGSERGKSAPLASTTNRYRKGGGMLAEISVADSNYNSFPNTTASGHPNRRPHHHHQVSGTQYDEQGNAYVYGKGAYDPLSPPLTAGSSTGLKTPRLDWRPPTLTPWSRSGKSTSDGASDVDLEGRGGNGHHRGNDSISFPAQAYTEQGKPKEKAGGLFGFMSRKHNKGETYVLVNASPPIGSPPPQYARNGSMEGQDTPQTSATLPVNNIQDNANIYNLRNGLTSPPLPPLPHVDSEPTTKGESRPPAAVVPVSNPTTTAPTTIPSSQSTPRLLPTPPTQPSSASTTAPQALLSSSIFQASSTESGGQTLHTFTANTSESGHATIIANPNRVSVPSPRVSSLYHSRLSSHSYTPASPGLPDPSIPPVPAIPAHLQQHMALGRSSSSNSTKTKKTATDSLLSIINNRGSGSTPSMIIPSMTSSISDSEANHFMVPTQGLDGKALPRTMVVTATFTPTLSDELPLTLGETVSMLEEYVDGWCFVQRVRVQLKDPKNASNFNQDILGNSMFLAGIAGPLDSTNTVTTLVEGEGNSGAIPRFCVSEWPLSTETIRQLMEANKALASAALSTTSTQAQQMSPLNIQVAHGISGPAGMNSATTTSPLVQGQHGFGLSKFSSWGSANTSMDPRGTTMMPSIGQIGAMQSNLPINMTPPASSVLRAHPSNPITGTNPFSNANAVSQPTHLAPVAEVNSLESSRAPSASSTPSTVIPPNAPQTSPISQIQSPLESVVEEDIKRVSKPPPAPRLSRFPESPEVYDPQAHMNMDIPRASERTMTMPPLPRQPTTTDPAPLSPPSLSQQNMHGNGNYQPAPSSHFNARNQPPYSAGVESTVASSGMGTSAGSNTPSTSQTGSSNQSGSFNRFANAAPPQITRNGTFAGSTTNTNRPGTGDRRANKPGQVSFRALRTGSSTAGVGTLGR